MTRPTTKPSHGSHGWAAVVLALTMSYVVTSRGAASSISFEDVAAQANVQVLDVSGGMNKVSLLETVGHGAAWLDYDRDGLLDLYVTNGSTLSRVKGLDTSPAAPCRLFRNQGNGTFSDETERAGVGGLGLWTMGAVSGDIDNDGYPDLYVTGFGRNILYRNRGDGTFEEATDKAGVRGAGWCTSAALGDYDRDGFLDLYVARYVDLNIHNFPTNCLYAGIRVACGPMGLRGQTDLLFRNNGDGTFRDVTSDAKIDSSAPYFGLGVVFLDYDKDGYPDIYVANDATPANLWHNNHDGTFTDRGTISGSAYNADGQEQARMGVDAADFDRSGYQSLFTTNFSGQTNSLFRNLGNGFFVDDTDVTGLGTSSIPFLGWGTKFVDYDNDGWFDLFVVNGHIYPEVDTHKLSYAYRQRILLYRNDGGRFREVAQELGGDLLTPIPGRGAAFADYDNDGDVDVFISNADALSQLLQNRGGSKNNFLTISLVGIKSNRDGTGALVQLTVAGTRRTQEARSGASYLSSNDPRLHFGLGSAPRAELVEITWPSGFRETVESVPANQFVTITEGQGISSSHEARVPEISTAQPQRRTTVPAVRPAIARPGSTAVPGDWKLATRALLTDKDYAGAARTIQQNLGRGPDEYQQVNLLATTLERSGQTRRANSFYIRALSLRPESVTVRLNLALNYVRLGQYKSAAAEFTRILKEDTRQGVQEPTYQQSPDDHTIAAFVRNVPARERDWYELGSLLMRYNRVQGAQALFAAASRLFPGSALLRYGMGWSLQEGGKFDEAAEAFSKALDLQSPYREAAVRLGFALFVRGKYGEAIDLYRRTLTTQPDSYEVHYFLGQSLIRNGDPDAAIQHLRKAMSINPQSFDSQVELGRIYLDKGMLVDAKNELELAVRLNPSRERAHYLLAQAYTRLNRPALAEKQLALFEEIRRQDYSRAREVMESDLLWASGEGSAGIAGRVQRFIEAYKAALMRRQYRTIWELLTDGSRELYDGDLARFALIASRVFEEPEFRQRLARLTLTGGRLVGGRIFCDFGSGLIPPLVLVDEGGTLKIDYAFDWTTAGLGYLGAR